MSLKWYSERMRKRLIILCACAIHFSCKQDAELVHEKMLSPADSSVQQENLVIRDSANGQVFTRLYKAGTQGMVYHYDLPQELINKHFYIVFKGKMRSNYAQSNGSVVFLAFDKNKSQLCWWSLPVRPHLVLQNQWNVFHDSLHIPGLINDIPYVSVHAFPFLGNSASENFDVDSLHVMLKQRQEY